MKNAGVCKARNSLNASYQPGGSGASAFWWNTPKENSAATGFMSTQCEGRDGVLELADFDLCSFIVKLLLQKTQDPFRVQARLVARL